MLIEEIAPPASDKAVITLSAFSIQGRRNHMEDFFDIGYQLKPCDQRRPNEWPYEYFYFGIFDGHGGREAALFAKRNLLKFITQQKDFWSSNDDDVMRAIRKGFADTHSAMKDDMPNWNRTNLTLPSTAGTTASILFIKNGKFYIGHVGDSRIVISQENNETKQWISHQLTEDHKPESKEETERIRRAGGDVRSKIGVHRVVWKRPVLTKELERNINCMILEPEDFDRRDEYIASTVPSYPISESMVESYQNIPFLAIARSLGDFWSLNPCSGQYTVSPEPDVSCRPISPNDKCILLATDGLWNVMNSPQAVRYLQELNILKNGKRQYHEDDYFATDNFYDVAGVDSENYAESMVYFAYQIWERRRLRSDNITVVVAMLHDILAQFHHKPNRAYATRASLQNQKEPIEICAPKTQASVVQIGQTKSFFEKIKLNDEPKFNITGSDFYNEEKWRRLESYLLLPPTIVEQEYDTNHPKLVYPKNYMRLSVAACRKITFRRFGHINIYIKQVSDDPADARKLPTRLNKAGKEVRDASGQATQCIHDFGQPWDQLLDDDLGEEDNLDCELDYPMDDEDDDTELVFIHELSEEEQLRLAMEDTDHDDSDSDDDLVYASRVKDQPKEEESIPQLRCLMNNSPFSTPAARTPSPRRSSRINSHLSKSENAKRKFEIPSSVSCSDRQKRRRSQPIRCR